MGYEVGEYDSPEEVFEVAKLINDHGEAFVHWLDYVGDREQAVETFSDYYEGTVGSANDWAWKRFEECEPKAYALAITSEYVHFDPEEYVSALEADGWNFFDLSDGSVAIFSTLA